MMTEQNLIQLQRDLQSFSRVLIFGPKSPIGTYKGSRPFGSGAKLDINLAMNTVKVKDGKRGLVRKIEEVGRISIEYRDGTRVVWVQDKEGQFVRSIV